LKNIILFCWKKI